jgi:hypothetical protein
MFDEVDGACCSAACPGAKTFSTFLAEPCSKRQIVAIILQKKGRLSLYCDKLIAGDGFQTMMCPGLLWVGKKATERTIDASNSGF